MCNDGCMYVCNIIYDMASENLIIYGNIILSNILSLGYPSTNQVLNRRLIELKVLQILFIQWQIR